VVVTQAAGDGTLRLSLVIVDEPSYRATLADDLEREVIQIETLPASVLSAGREPSAPVVLIWLPPNAPESLLAEVVGWQGRAPRPTAIIGCAPDGTGTDCERALAFGFDDFVIGPVSVRELAGRIRALYRRLRSGTGARRQRLRFGSVSVDSQQHQLWVGEERILVTPTELSVMSVLVAARGGTRTRAQILDEAWGDHELEIGERAVDNVILRLRRKIGDPDLIITVRGIGFRLAGR
jgi:DNA-binding response OmpR family regulator